MIEIKTFQKNAATQLSDKVINYMKDPLMKTRTVTRPFYQNLSAITGSGKTVILADFLAQIRLQLPIAPIVLWISKGKVVIWQTYDNLSTGTYKDITKGYNVKKLLECNLDDIQDKDNSLLLVATVAKFNQKDIANSDRKIFEIHLDKATDSLWNLLKIRKTKEGIRRNLIIVYDEGHNLSDQQTKLIIDDLQPDALITASATMKLPSEMEKLIKILKQDKGWEDKDLIIPINSKDVVTSGLIKKGIELNGYNTSMEIAVDDMIRKLEELKNSIKDEKLKISPKAIYVTNTNLIMNTKYNDNVEVPFKDRRARPIVIWRYLVSKGIEPDNIAIYCNLKFDKAFPPPSNFNLFSGGDGDYDKFKKGNYKHIIFNLSLQEGWDDPECYCAYIDKDMGSELQISQVVGRVLRQPGITHYKHEALNVAYFYIRSDEKKVFKKVIKEIEEKITKEIPDLDITFSSKQGGSNKITYSPKINMFVPEIATNTEEAKMRIKKIVAMIPDYKKDYVNTIGKGNKMQMKRYIGANDQDSMEYEWVEIENNNKVSARWIFVTELNKYNKKLKNVCDIEQSKFDAFVEYNSIAANIIKDFALKIVDEYIKYSEIVVIHDSAHKIQEMTMAKDGVIKFKNSLHEGYNGFNNFEKVFAIELDKQGVTWFRNKNSNFFEIPLLDKGDTNNFNPDFVVWNDESIVTIDTKGDHILAMDKERKLFELRNIGDGPEIKIKLVSEGTWKREDEKRSKDGYTVWNMKNSKIVANSFDSIEETVNFCLK
ncbi:DEAD/DEAH box helicase family protein [Clostridium sp. DL1XJH146]